MHPTRRIWHSTLLALPCSPGPLWAHCPWGEASQLFAKMTSNGCYVEGGFLGLQMGLSPAGLLSSSRSSFDGDFACMSTLLDRAADRHQRLNPGVLSPRPLSLCILWAWNQGTFMVFLDPGSHIPLNPGSPERRERLRTRTWAVLFFHLVNSRVDIILF